MSDEPKLSLMTRGFHSPQESWVDCIHEDKKLFGGVKRTPGQRKIVYSYKKMLADVKSFVNAIKPEHLININEFTRCRYRLGDDGLTHVVVWYWGIEEEEEVSVE